MTGFALTILLGAFLLSLPAATVDGRGLPVIDALFTATSAVCVTGLVVVDTGTTFTTFGQVVILLLIKVGGLGFMTFGTLFAVLAGRRIYFRERLILQEALNQNSVEGIIRMVRYIALATFLVEGLGTVLLAARLSGEMGWSRGFYMGVFHAVSAFNNAGFDLMGNFTSLTAYTSDYFVSLVVASLFILGGLGFAVSLDLVQHRRFSALSLHSKVVLTTTAGLLVAGVLLVYGLEYGNPQTLGSLNGGTKWLASFFQSATARTAGFNTIDIASLRVPTLFIIILLMFIGASPGSTGGGIKTTTFAAIVLMVRCIVMGEENINAFQRRVAGQLLRKAMTIFFISLTVVIVSTLALTITEGTPLLPSLFEATSAFGTVGLSMGLTGQLTLAGKIVVIITMFTGRLGPLTLALALGNNHRKTNIKFPEDKISVG